MQRIGRALGFVAGGAAFYLVVELLWAPPAGIIAQGALLGGLTSLLAIGIALVYRAHRIVNFAAGDLGAVPGVLAVLLVVSSGASWLLAFCTGIAASLALGAAVEFLIVRRFLHAPRLSLTVVTIGLAQVLAGIGLLLPNWFQVMAPPQVPFPAPIHASLTIDPITFGGNDLVAVIAIVVAFVGLAVFLRTRLGVAMRGCADNPDRAAMLGIPVRAIHMQVWAIASCLAFLAVFLRAGIVGLPIGTVLGPPILLRALAAAVIGRMERLPTIAVAAIALGIVEQAVYWHLGDEHYVDPVLFVIILVALLVIPTGAGLRRGIDPSSWRAVREPRPVPPETARRRDVRAAFAVVAVLAVGALCVVPALIDESHVNLAAIVLIYALIGLSLVVLSGWAGEISLGQMAFVGIGAAVGGSITARLGWDLGLAMLCGGLVGAAVTVLVGLPALRRRGLTIAVVTLAFALTTTSWVLNPQVFGPGTRFDWLPAERVARVHVLGFIDVGSETRFYYLCLVVLLLAAIAVLGIRRSRSGRVLVAIRENEEAASAYGVNTHANLMVGFAISGFLAGLAGVLFVHQQNGVQLASYSAAESLVVFAMAVIGGLGSIPGALLGALYVRGANYFLPVAWQILATGVGMIVVLLLFRGGLGAVLADVRDLVLRRLARRHDRSVPTPVSDAPPRSGTPGAISGSRPRETTARPPVLSVRGLDVAYDGVQVLFGVDLEVGRGEVVALVGTNGSGKSTVLRAVSGLARAQQGTIVFGDIETTHARPEKIAAQGAVQSPGGVGVFPSLTVAENLRLAGWLRQDVASGQAATGRVIAAFPVLGSRMRERAGNLSGGEQQLLTLGMAFVAAPKLLMIDELSLGLSPALIDTVIDHVRALSDRGTAVLIVDQSVELALRLAARAYFLEKGRVRFVGPTVGLLDHPELIRAVLLGARVSTIPPRVGAPRRSAPALAVRGVTKRYGGVVALDDVSLTLGEHEIVGVLGPNGAGKTTLFDVVSGLTRPDAGQIELQTTRGIVDVTAMRPYARARLGLGRSFQDGRLFPALTVRETVEVALERDVKVKNAVAAAFHLPSVSRSESAVRARAEALLGSLGLDDFSDKFVRELSTGTRRLVDLACALAHEPSVLLLDEPSSGIAQPEAEALAPVLRSVRDALGTSMLVIEHDLVLLGSLAERLVVLDVGSVLAEGPPAHVLHDPAVVRAYLGREAGMDGRPASS